MHPKIIKWYVYYLQFVKKCLCILLNIQQNLNFPTQKELRVHDWREKTPVQLGLSAIMFVSFWYSNITENFKNYVNPTLIACCSVANHASQNVTHSGRILKKVQKMHWASSSHIQKHAKQQQQSPTLPSSVEFHPKNNANKLQWTSLIWFDFSRNWLLFQLRLFWSLNNKISPQCMFWNLMVQ